MTVAAIAIVVTITALWVLATQHLLSARIKWRVVGLALLLGALSPLPILLAFDLGGVIPMPQDPGLDDALAASLGLAAIPEELVKAIAVVTVILLLRHHSVSHNDIDPATAFRLPILCGLGFAAVENIAYSLDVDLASMFSAKFEYPLIVPLARSILASLLHASLGCLMGLFFTRFAVEGRLRWSAAFAGYAAAVIGHAAVNWGLIAAVLILFQSQRKIDQIDVDALASHFLLAAILIPCVVLTAIVSVVVMRRRLRPGRGRAEAAV